MAYFRGKSVKELQEYLKIRGVVYSNVRKLGLAELCEKADSLGVEVDPDGLTEDRESVLREKLTADDGTLLTSPQLLNSVYDISSVSSLSIFDIYNYLLSFDEYNHSTLRQYDKLEGYTLQKDGYVLDLKTVDYPNKYVAIKSCVKPRTSEKDPVTKLPHYLTWIILQETDSTENNCTSVKSAYCTCKGGVDGCCRHVIATLFEVIDYCQDSRSKSCTSGPCQWIRRASEANKLSKPMPVSQLNTSITDSRPDLPRPCNFPTLSDTFDLPNPDVFLEGVKNLYPKACILDTKHVRKTELNLTPTLDVETPMQKLASFLSHHKCIVENCLCSNIFIHYYLCYSESEQNHVEVVTRGQSQNNNWFNMRKALITASNFKLVFSSTDLTKTGQHLLRDPLGDDCLPAPIQFGRRFEDKARDMYLKSHRFKHRQCQVCVPGLILSSDDECPFLGCSPDGIISCKICGSFLIEIKCSYKFRSFYPKVALKMSSICQEDENGSIYLKNTHPYYHQIQGQMAVTGIKKCVLVYYTHKGIHCVDVDFDEEFWIQSRTKLLSFYKSIYFTQLKQISVAAKN